MKYTMRDIGLKIIALKLWPYQVFLVMALSFVAGVSIGGFWAPAWQVAWLVYIFATVALLLAGFINYILDNRIIVIISWSCLFLILGLADYSYHQAKFCILKEGEISTSGTIVANPIHEYDKQQVIIELSQNNCVSRALINLPRFPVYDYGDRIKLTGQLKKPGMIEDFDYSRYLHPKFISYLIINPKEILLEGKEYGTKIAILGTLYKVKNAVEASIFRSIREPEASLAAGILTGYRASLSDDFKNDLNSAGLTHLIALSGFNITIIIGAITFALIGWTSRRNVFIVGIILSLSFIVMTGASASVVRAGIFSILILYGATIGRKAYQTNILLLTATAMLAFNPFLLRDDMGFQLSFLAFAGLIYLARPVSFWLDRSVLARLPQGIKGPLIETLSAQIAVFPLIAFAFGRISLISPISNILVLSLVPVTMALIFIVAISGLVFYPLGLLTGLAAWPFLAYIVLVTKWAARLPFAAANIPKYDMALIAGCYTCIVLTYYLSIRKMKRLRKL